MNIDIALPVGPFANDARWLNECITSIAKQTHKPATVYLVDDMSGFDVSHYALLQEILGPVPLILHKNVWRLGCANSWNIAIASSPSEHVFMMCADDWLEETCLANCVETYRQHPDPIGYYYARIRYEANNEEQDLPCNAAMVSKTLWRHTGGFPLEASLGAPDGALVSILLGKQGAAGNIIRLLGGILYNVRSHEHQETRRQNLFHAEIQTVRDKLTANWTTPVWTDNVTRVSAAS